MARYQKAAGQRTLNSTSSKRNRYRHLQYGALARLRMDFQIKRYFRARVPFWRPATFRPYLKHAKPFLTRVGELYPDLDSFNGVTREMIEPALNHPYWIDQTEAQRPITP